MKKLRVGVVGAGYLGKFHAEKYSQMDDVELAGIADLDRVQAEAVSKKVRTNAYTDYRDLIGKVDAVSVVVPTPAHYKVSRDFLENDIDVLIEKPITTTLSEADELINISETRGLIIQVGHLERFNPAILALKDIVKNPRFIESHRLSIFKERGTDVSVVLDLMIHDIDIISGFVKSEIRSIHAAGIPVITDRADIANTRLEFMNGCVANVTASRISTKNERKIRLFQQDAYISVDFANHEITIVRKKGGANESVIPGMDIEQLCFEKSDALKDELTAFVKAVSRREVPEVTGQVGRDALKVALSVMDQIDSSKKQLVDQ
jgi:predicted dehydrogenase